MQYVVLEMEDYWMTADKLEKERRAQAVVPPSIFDLPWADDSKKPRPS